MRRELGWGGARDMNLNDPQNWQAVAAVIGAVALIFGAVLRMQSAIMTAMDTNRDHSEAGRTKIYERIERMDRDNRDAYITRIEHATDFKALAARQDDIVRRIEQQCAIVRSRRDNGNA